MLIIVILITYKENKTCTINKLAFIMTKSSHTTTSQLNYEDKSSVKEYFMNEDKSMKHYTITINITPSLHHLWLQELPSTIQSTGSSTPSMKTSIWSHCICYNFT